MRNQFVLDTRGHCFICLKSAKLAESGSPDYVTTTEGLQDGIPSKVFSLHRLCRHLGLNMRKIFHDAITPTTLPILEKSELQGLLCDECGRLTKTFSEVTMELEILQMKLDSCLYRIRENMEAIETDKDRMRIKVMEEFKREMLSSSQTMHHYGIMEQLRKETLKKSSLLIGKSLPRVSLRRLSISRHNLPLKVEVQGSPPSPVFHTPTMVKPEFVAPLSPAITTPERAITTPERESCYDDGPLSPDSYHGPYSRNENEEESEPILEKVTKCIKIEPDESSVLSSLGTPTSSTSNPGKSRGLTNQVKVKPSITTFQLSSGDKPRLRKTKRVRKTFSRLSTAPPVQGHECYICHDRFLTREMILEHTKNMHTDNQGPFGLRRFPCPYCRKIFPNHSKMLEHKMRLHSNLIKVVSSTSPATNYHRHEPNIPIQLGNVERIEINEGSNNDPLSEFMLEGEEDESESFQPEPETQDSPDEVISTEEPEPDLLQSFKCNRCPKEFQTMRNLKHHITRVHDSHNVERKFECKVCNKRFVRATHLATHRRGVHERQRFACQFCSKEFTQLGNMKAHMEFHCRRGQKLKS